MVGEKTKVHGSRRPRPAQGMAERWSARSPASARSTSRKTRRSLLVDDANAVLPRLFEAAEAAGARITAVNVVEPNLETVFLHLTGRALRE